MPRRNSLVDRRILTICALALAIGVLAALVARALVALIGLFTNLAYFGRWSYAFVSPADHHLGAWAVLVPVAGGLVVGLMARWGSPAIRGHGIPEAMEQILRNDSKIPPRMTFLKPLSSAIAIGTGGPFGAEGPIIATGGALGSFLGQVLHVTASERKVLLAAGAAAGMAAVFASPVSATILAVELLLFELRPRSLIPVALATVSATAIRYATVGFGAVFPMPEVATPDGTAIAVYVGLGAVVGLLSVAVTRLVYGIEDAFERLPVHWMWWPAIGGLAVGIVGYFAPATLGVGYSNIESIIAGHLAFDALLFLCVMKFVSWSIALGSGTSGGTLAPLFTIGGAFGAVVGQSLATHAPALGIDPRIAALVGMAAIFAGASRALLTSIVFAFETTRQFAGLLPLLGGCTAAYLLSALTMRTTIMTEKIARRGTRVPDEYAADFLDQVTVGEVCTRDVRSLADAATVGEIRAWFASDDPRNQHQGYPVVDADGRVRGVITRRQIQTARQAESTRLGELLHQEPIVVQERHSLREAADHMVTHSVGRLIVVADAAPHAMVGIITRGDLLAAHARRLRESREAETHIRLRAG
ncbi:MAG: chloride channel protein [Gammaproteobacteria bacterium]|nr:chloride channel protein [Gammaproteobacteria bacterium]